MIISAITPCQKHDYLTETILQGLEELGHKVCVSDVGNSIYQAYSEKKFIDIANQSDCLLVFFGKIRGNNPPKYYLYDKIKKKCKTAYIDGSEWTYSGYPNENQTILSKKDSRFRKGYPWINEVFFKKCDFYFKRECYPEDQDNNIIPLPFAVIKKYIFNEKNIVKKNDIFCSFGQTNDGLRFEIEHFLKKWNSEYSITVEKGLSYDLYLKKIASSKLCVDAWGGGDCNARFWEIVANKSCIVYQKHNIIIPYPYRDLFNCIEFKTVKEFEEKIVYVLNNKELLEEITNNCYEHTMKYHTSHHRAKYMLEKMGLNS